MLVKVQHGFAENQRTLSAVLLVRPLLGRVADAVFGTRKHHGGRDQQLCHGRVVASPRARRDALVAAGSLDAVDGFGPEVAGQQVHGAVRFGLQAVQRRDALDALHDCLAHRLEALGLLVHQAEGDFGFRLDVASAPRAAMDAGDCCVSILLKRELFELNDELCGTSQRVSATIHGIGICVSVLSLEMDIVPRPFLEVSFFSIFSGGIGAMKQISGINICARTPTICFKTQTIKK